MRVGTPEIRSDGREVTWSVSVTEHSGTPERLWFKVPEKYGGMITSRADPAVIGLLIPAMCAGGTVHIEGPVTDELAHNLRHGYQQILRRVIGGSLSEIGIDTPQEAPAGTLAPGVATGFSAGVDSFAVVVDHYLSRVPPAIRLTHLTFFNVGSHGRGDRGRELFSIRHRRVERVADQMGLPLIKVDSNLDDFFGLMNFQQTNGPRNIAAASLLQEGIGRYFLASSFPYEHIGVRRAHDTAFSDPISLPLLTTASFRPMPHGDEYTRVEKTRLIASAPITHSSLDVCVRPRTDGRNCSQCMKCMRTQLTLEIAGQLGDFEQVFDFDRYRNRRAAYLDEVKVSSDEFAVEIREFARESGFELPGPLTAHWRHGGRVSRTRLRRAAFRVLSASGTLGVARRARDIVKR